MKKHKILISPKEAKKIRLDLGYTIEQFSEKTGLKKYTIRRIERVGTTTKNSTYYIYMNIKVKNKEVTLTENKANRFYLDYTNAKVNGLRNELNGSIDGVKNKTGNNRIELYFLWSIVILISLYLLKAGI